MCKICPLVLFDSKLVLCGSKLVLRGSKLVLCDSKCCLVCLCVIKADRCVWLSFTKKAERLKKVDRNESDRK